MNVGNTIVSSNVTAVGTSGTFGPGKHSEQRGFTRCMHVEASAGFTAQVRGTNFVSYDSNGTLVGSNWANVGSAFTSGGLFRFDTNQAVQLYHVQFTAVSGRVDIVVF